MSLPKSSTWNFIMGTWFVYHSEDDTVHIQLKNNGKQLIYINEELVSEQRTFKLSSEQIFDYNENHYRIKISPDNKALTSFSTDLIIDGELKMTYSFRYKRNTVSYIFMMILIIALTTVFVLLKLPDWSFYVMVFVLIVIKLLFFNSDMFEITEKANTFKQEI